MATLPVNPVTAKSAGGGGGAVATPQPGGPPIPSTAIPATGTSNPTVPFGGAPTTLGSGIGTGISTGLSTDYGDYTLAGDFSQTYGKGTGTALEGVLANLGTSTDGAVSATNAAALQTAGIQGANISSGEAAAGVSADSSTAALAQGDFASQVNTQLQATDSQMELGEENTLISSLQNEGSAHGGDSTGWDTFSDVLSAIPGLGGLAQGASSAISGISPGADTSILDALGAI